MIQPPRQLPLPLGGRPSTARDDFVVTGSNRRALGFIDRWPDWPGPALVLVGPEGSGKTHLAAILRERADALGRGLDVVEDADRSGLTEAELFHRWNAAISGGASLLLTARSAPALWPVTLPDLVSRLRSAPLAELDPPDDALLLAVIAKLFSDRQLAVEPDVVGYIARRIERSLAAASAAVAAIDSVALAEGRAIGKALAGRVLGRDGV